MADLSFTPLQYQGPKGMSLGEMVNLAGGVQQLQQAQQMNPLLLQEAQQRTRTGQINLGVAEQSDLERKNLQTYMSNPENWQTNGKIDLEKLNAQISRIAPLTGPAQIEKLTTLAKAQTESRDASQKLTQSQRAIIAGPLGVMGRAGIQDPNAYTKELEVLKEQNPDNPELHRLIDAQKKLIGQTTQGPHVADAAKKVAESLMTPQEQVAYTKPQLTTNAAGEIVSANPVTGKMEIVRGTGNINPTAADVTLGSEYQKNLADRVVASNQFLQRAEEIEPLLNEFKPGAGTSTYAKIAEKLQALGASQGLVDSVAKGDLSAVQSLNKFMAQSVMSTARQAASGKPYANEIDDFVKNNPTIETDPRALKRFIDFNKKLARTDLVENETLAQAKTQGIYNPGTWQADWQKIAQSKGLLPKTPSAQSKEPAKEPTKTQERTVVRQGTYNGRTVIEYSDGSVRYK